MRPHKTPPLLPVLYSYEESKPTTILWVNAFF